MVFELHQDEDKGNFYVVIIFNGKVLNYPLRDLDYSYSEGKIDLGTFRTLLSKRIDDDWKRVDCSEAENSEKEKFNIFPISLQQSSKMKKKHLKDFGKKVPLNTVEDKLKVLFLSEFGENN